MPPALINKLRMLRMGPVFAALRQYVTGDVLDVGGRDFYPVVQADAKISYTSWTCLELERSAKEYADTKYQLIVGSGEVIPSADGTFDTVVNLQVLEHTLHPHKMLSECARVLKPGGRAIFFIPQTAAMHEIPTHYYNFTKYFIELAFPEAGLTIESLTPIGGRWTTHASHMFHFFLEAFRVGSYSSPEYRRKPLFYVLFPFMAVYALFGIAFGMLFGLADLQEDPNNLLVIARKS